MALTPEQQDWINQTGRQSFHWADIPDAYESIPGIMDWANDPGSDPNASVQSYLNTIRQGAAPGTVDQGDAEALAQTAGGSYGTGADATRMQLDQILAAIQATNQQPDVDLSGIGPGDMPTFTVPGENLSPSIDSTLLELMGGTDPLGLENRYLSQFDQLQRMGDNFRDPAQLQNRLEGARENLTRGSEAAMADLRAILADRGLLSLPGFAEGEEGAATVRALEPLQRAYLGEVRQIEADEYDKSQQREMDLLDRQSTLLSQATGWSQNQVAQRLAAAGSAQERQKILSDISLEVLGKNMEWNKFLAEFGLDRERLANEIKMGNINNIMPVLQMILQLFQQGRGGYI